MVRLSRRELIRIGVLISTSHLIPKVTFLPLIRTPSIRHHYRTLSQLILRAKYIYPIQTMGLSTKLIPTRTTSSHWLTGEVVPVSFTLSSLRPLRVGCILVKSCSKHSLISSSRECSLLV